MIRILFKSLLATLLLAPVTAIPAHAAPASVEIVSPADGSSGYATDLWVSGKAHSPTAWVYVTVTGDINVYEGFINKSNWSTHVNELPAGPTTICAEVRDGSGAVLARDCNAFTVTADPRRLDVVFPEEGAVEDDTVWVVALCVTGTAVRLTMDAGETVQLPCENWAVDRNYTGLAEGSHMITAGMVDQGAVVATVVRTFTVDLPDPGTVSISSPADGSSGYVGRVIVSGTATSWNNGVYIFADGVESYITSTDESGRWEVPLDHLGVGSHTICAAVRDRNFDIETQDCITYTVRIDPGLLVVNSPAQGSTSGPHVVVDGWCADGTTVTLSMDGDQPAEQPCSGLFQQEYYNLADGAHTLSVTMLHDGAPIVTRERSFTVDATAPAAPAVTSPSTRTTITEPTLPLVGTAEPGTTIEVYPADRAVSWSTSTADDGSWSLTLDSSFFDLSGIRAGRRGQLTVNVVAIDAYDNRSAPSTYLYTVHLR